MRVDQLNSICRNLVFFVRNTLLGDAQNLLDFTKEFRIQRGVSSYVIDLLSVFKKDKI